MRTYPMQQQWHVIMYGWQPGQGRDAAYTLVGLAEKLNPDPDPGQGQLRGNLELCDHNPT